MIKSNKNPDPEESKPELLPAPLAYLNPDFLGSPDGRILRILSEYAEPLSRFRREKIQDTVVFFGSARFASLPDAQNTLTILEKPGSAKPAQPQDQPGGEDGDALQAALKRAMQAWRWRAITRKRAGWHTCSPTGHSRCRANATGLW